MTEYLDRVFSLEGRSALVAGASRGIGASIARALSGAGATVTAVGRSPVPAEDLPGILYRSCDVCDSSAFEDVCDSMMVTDGALDIYVHAAGVSISSEPEQTAEIFELTLQTNLIAAHRCCRLVSMSMRAGGRGSIINVTSIGSVLGFPGNPGYVASKGGLRMLTKALAVDWAPHNIRVNNLVPGYIRTAMTEASYRDPERNVERLNRTLLRRWGTPDDLVGAAIFLASDASSYVTGTDIFVDGGWTVKGI